MRIDGLVMARTFHTSVLVLLAALVAAGVACWLVHRRDVDRTSSSEAPARPFSEFVAFSEGVVPPSSGCWEGADVVPTGTPDEALRFSEV